MQEIWKDIEGYDGIYQVSNMGRVRSRTRKVHNYMKPGRVLKTSDNGHSYLSVGLSLNGVKQKHSYVHRLVAQAFIPNPNNYSDVNHKDFDKANNCVENLEWVSSAQNKKHYRESRYASIVKSNTRERQFGNFAERIMKNRDAICGLYDTGLTVVEVAKALDVGRDFVSTVLRLYDKIPTQYTPREVIDDEQTV